MGQWDKDYYWVVLCKNPGNHLHKCRPFEHIILLGETDSISPPPALQSTFQARCAKCGQEHSYQATEVLRYEATPPDQFVPHPLFVEA